jgi:hypothetical protein
MHIQYSPFVEKMRLSIFEETFTSTELPLEQEYCRTGHFGTAYSERKIIVDDDLSYELLYCSHDSTVADY